MKRPDLCPLYFKPEDQVIKRIVLLKACRSKPDPLSGYEENVLNNPAFSELNCNNTLFKNLTFYI